MTELIIDDLQYDIELDREALADIRGGFLPIPYPNTYSRRGTKGSPFSRIWSPPVLQGLDLDLTGTGLRPYIRPLYGG